MHQLLAIRWRSIHISVMVSVALVSAGLRLVIIIMFGICASVVFENTSPFRGRHCPEICASDNDSVLMKVLGVFIPFCSIWTVTYYLLNYSFI